MMQKKKTKTLITLYCQYIQNYSKKRNMEIKNILIHSKSSKLSERNILPSGDNVNGNY